MPDPNDTTTTQGSTADNKGGDKEIMIPKARFDEVNEEKKSLEARLKAKEDQEKADTERRLTEQSQFKELAEKRGKDLEDAQAKASRVDAMEKTLANLLAKEIEAIPEDRRGLVPEKLSDQDKLEWIAKNSAILRAPDPMDIGAGRQGGSDTKPVKLENGELETAKQFGLKPEEYAKYK